MGLRRRGGGGSRIVCFTLGQWRRLVLGAAAIGAANFAVMGMAACEACRGWMERGSRGSAGLICDLTRALANMNRI